LKGKTREACEWIASGQGIANPDCLPPAPKGVCKKCIVCSIFGAPGGGGELTSGLYWDNAYLTEDWQQATGKKNKKNGGQLELSSPRTQVGISRSRGVAQEGLLFTGEFSAEQLTFQTRVTGHLTLTPVAEEKGRYYELILLVSGLKLVTALGGNTSRGAGLCEIKLPKQVVIQSSEYSQEELDVDFLINRLDLLSLYNDEVEAAQ
jgi:CRISPR/Cas system CSM-associated protein Csm3 (group 7 of RAMP superfamily)